MTFLVDGTLGGTFPSWTTATRPASPAVGQMGYNTTTGQFDAYTSNGWTSVATSATAPTNGPAFSAYMSANATFTSGTTVKVTLDVETFDTNSNFSSSRFTPTVAGYYQINGKIRVTGTNLTSVSNIWKNGAAYTGGTYTNLTSGLIFSVVSAVVYLNGSTDYVELYAYADTTVGSPTLQYISVDNTCTMSGALVRSA
ncbi:hypothetical protein UFOVP1640_13 [uncultured Caudovirales phage]|uniref:Uncharacterized protein n=1 Tax=uncultured Caudovirales phage TaxID=2100421 RepID=A0A6J5RP74_9CAUD|nr:hypothetical protein UFOVP1286_16 [uncultured Caudovirales phage]CAB4205555.1 hypothetical protein UFOVP1407_46 [uncultured Caudovirales phage]CAB4221612.1 hypothetical protein UFOVP1640_13 [uncultured Caudovirales phage]